MLRYVLILVLALLLAAPASPTTAEENPSATAGAAGDGEQATPPQTTIVHGHLPSLVGRWIFLADVELGGKVRTIPSFYDISSPGGKLEVVEHFVKLPDDVQADIEAAQRLSTPWEPSKEILERIDEDWNELSDSRRGIRDCISELWSSEAFDDTVKQEEISRDAQWLMRQKYDFLPGGNRPTTQVNVFTGAKHEGDTWTGRYTAATVIATPFPVPITFKGSLRMIRLGEGEQPGLLARLLDMLKGCGR